MKFIIVFMGILVTGTAYSKNLKCQKRLTAFSNEMTKVSFIPNPSIISHTVLCTEYITEDVIACREVLKNTFIDEQSICSQKINFDHCISAESSKGFSITCDNGISIKFNLDSQSIGTVSCSKDQIIEGSWDLGLCKADSE